MATAVLSNPDPQKFPPGATVKAYKRSNFPAVPAMPTGAPQGSQDASATVAADASITFTGLADSTAYVLYAASPDRYAAFSTPNPVGAGPDFGLFSDGQFAQWDATAGQFVGAAVPAADLFVPGGNVLLGAELAVSSDEADPFSVPYFYVFNDGSVYSLDDVATSFAGLTPAGEVDLNGGSAGVKISATNVAGVVRLSQDNNGGFQLKSANGTIWTAKISDAGAWVIA